MRSPLPPFAHPKAFDDGERGMHRMISEVDCFTSAGFGYFPSTWAWLHWPGANKDYEIVKPHKKVEESEAEN